jgi:transcriptional regulator with GAF, ATPase, and Fis domain
MRAKTRVDMIGRSPEILALQEEVERIARSDAKVLITGESGFGLILLICIIVWLFGGFGGGAKK